MNRKHIDEESIFATAIEKTSPEEREKFLKQECGDNPKLFDRLNALVKSHDEETGFLKPPEHAGVRIELNPVSEGAGTVIGPYKLLQQIGEGGFGVVYMAEQQRPVRRKVALKIIKPGMDTKQVVARFEAERQALALMDHPNIAKVLDAGATESGRPYFVMELVKGVPITEYCDKNNLTTEERLALFVQVCRAVQHAHQKGVIHRDIKPSNVMVTLHDGHPVPKVIDFGVSKAISQQLTEKTLFTAYGQMIGTPQYMSPEQAEMSGLDVDTRSDVYSLGVLLYELLTGTTPLDSERLRTLAYVEMQRVIREEDPPRPSARLSTMGGELTVVAKHRSTDAKRLAQLLRGDLDWIVMKSLSKERGRRYESASTFAADIEHHLADETIEARPPSASYQIARFVRRHKGPAIAAAIVLLVLLLGIAGTTTFLIVAKAEAQRARFAEKAAVEAEEVAVGAEKETQTALQESKRLAGELSTSLAKVSEGAARMAAQRAQTLVAQDRPQEALLWLNRALELLPARGTPLEREIRTAMSVVAEKLPHPLFVVAPDDGQVFSKTDVSLDGEKILLLVETDPPAEPKAIEVRVFDTGGGAELSRIDVTPGTYWAGFSGDGKTVLTADPSELHRYGAESGTSLGPTYDLAKALEEHAFRGEIPKIVAVDPSAKTAVFDAEPGGFRFRRRFGLLDLESGRTELLPKYAVIPQFAPDGRRYFLLDSDVQSRTIQIRAWNLADGEFQHEAWELSQGEAIGLSRLVPQWSISAAGNRALLSISGLDAGMLRIPDAPIPARIPDARMLRILDLQDGGLPPADLELSGEIIDSALSPSGRRAVVLTSPDPGSTEITIWDVANNRSRSIPLRLTFSNPLEPAQTAALGRLLQPRNGQNGRVAIGASEDTVLTWNHDLLVGWRLAPEASKRMDLATVRTVQSLQYQGGGEELAVIAYGTTDRPLASFGGTGGPGTGLPDPVEILRFNTQQRRRIGPVLPIVADLATLSPNGKTLATARDGEIQCWDLATMRKIGESFVVPKALGPPARGALRPKFFGQDSTRLAFVNGGRTLVGISSASVRSRSQYHTRVTYFFIGVTMSPVEQGLLAKTVMPGTPAEAAGLEAGDVILRIGDEPIGSMAEFRKFVDLESAGGIELTFLRDGKEQKLRLKPNPRTKEDVLVQTAAAVGEVRLWDTESGRELGELPIPLEGDSPDPWGLSAAVAPDGRSVVTVSQFGQRAELRKFDAASGRPVAPSVEYPRSIRQIQYGPRGRVLATIDSSREVQLWNADNLTRIGSRIRPTGTVDAMAFDPEGGALLVASDTRDGPRLTIWDTATGYRLSPSIELPTSAHRLACSPDGTTVAIAGRSSGVWEFPLPRIWDADATESAQRVEALAGCTLTEQGDVEPLEPTRWNDQFVQVGPAPFAHEPHQGEDSQMAWETHDVTSILSDRASTDQEKLAAWDAFIEKHPNLVPARMARAAMRLTQERFEQAAEDLEVAVAHGKRETIIAWLTTQAVKRPFGVPYPELIERSTEKCLWCCERILAMEPNEPTALLLRTLALAQAGRFDEAEEAMQAAVIAGPEDLVFENLWAMTATSFIYQGRFLWSPSIGARANSVERSNWLLDRLIEMRSDDWRPLVERAGAAVGEERLDDALADIDRAAKLGPAKKIAAKLGLFATLIDSRRDAGEEGESPLDRLRLEMWLPEKALELDPDHRGSRRKLAELYGQCADWEKAAKQFTRLKESDAEDYTSRNRLAALLVKLGQTKPYRELCRELQEKNDGSTVASLWSADAVDDYGPFIERAQTWLDDPNLAAKEHPYAQWNLGCAYFRSGKHAQAIEWLEKCAESADTFSLFESQIRALSVLAMAYHESGDVAKARQSLDRAAKLYDEKAPEPGVDDLGASWFNWLVCELLLEEAKGKIAGGEK